MKKIQLILLIIQLYIKLYLIYNISSSSEILYDNPDFNNVNDSEYFDNIYQSYIKNKEKLCKNYNNIIFKIKIMKFFI